MAKGIVPLNKKSDAFKIFSENLIPFVLDIRLEIVRFDIGDYTHLLKSAERLERVFWIRAALIDPDEIRKSHFGSQPLREIYIKKIFKDESDANGEIFIVCVDRKIGSLDFRTAFVAEESYFKKLKLEKLLWKRENK
jgi:hypothetical protein